MIDLYTWSTPNGIKVSIMLEECGLPYNIRLVDINSKQQHEPYFVALNPNRKIPVIVDSDGPGGKPITLFESGAILIYLAEKAGKLFPQEPRARYETIQWLMFQMANIGPLIGQAHHFRKDAPEKIEYAINRYTDEAARQYKILDERLAGTPYIAAGQYSIADIAAWPWIRRHERHGQKLEDFPNVKRWYDEIAARPAVQAGIEKTEAAKAAL